MKQRNILKLQFVLLTFLFTCLKPAFSQWSNVGGMGISNSWTTFNDIAVDTSGAPVVIFNENSTNLKCKKYDSFQWQDVGLNSFTFPWGGNTQLIIDSVYNIYYIAYSDVNNNYTSVVKFNGINWSYVGSQYIVNQSVNDFIMAIDNFGVLYCAFISSSGFQLFKDGGIGWQQISTTGLPSLVSNISITFDRQNNLLIAFTNMNDLTGSCMKLNGTVWQQLGNTTITTGGFAQYNKISVSGTNEVFYATQNINTCCYKLNASNIWQQLGNSGLGYSYIGIDDLIIDNNNRPTILTSSIASDKANCVYYDGNSWMKACGSSISDTTASSVAMAMDSQSNIYSIYNDYVAQKTYVRKCATTTSVLEIENKKFLKIYPNPLQDKTIIQTDVFMQNATLTLENCLGQIVKQIYHLNDQYITLFSDNLPSGLYFIRLTEKNKLIAQDKLLIIK